MAQLYEPYVYKPVDNFDLSLNITEFNPYYSAAYMSIDQTFHTPSFGDEEFDIPPLHIPLATGDTSVEQHQTYNPEENQQQQQDQQTMGEANTIAPSNSPTVGMMEPVHTSYSGQGAPELYTNQVTSPNSIQLTSHTYNMQQQSYVTSPTMEHQRQDIQCLQPSSTQPHQVSIGMQQQQPLLTTISRSQLADQLGLQIGMSMGRTTSIGNSPPGSNHTSPGLETSEDSDDNTQVNQMTGNMKRVESEHSMLLRTMAAPKKPKPQKKKKKKDPNEPQKPVSAYALFFRDRQAAIKGQNPNASFGEVSKIVASMWDSLDAEHKGGYKRKTEAAKKEYLKALAAYRASLVSKAAADQSETVYTSTTSPVSNSSSPSSSPDMVQCISPVQKKSPPISSSPPILTNMNAVSPTHASNKVWNMAMTTSPTLVRQGSPIMQTSPGDHSPPTMTHHISSPPHISQSQMAQSPPPITNQSMSPSYGQNIVHSPSPPHKPQSMSQLPISHSPLQTCLRQGCNNPPIDSPDWDREYCSSECVVSHCRDVFTAWVASRQTTNSYAVK
uniref:Thymocyte selection-associated high mobility group box protein TOX n=1 Tax=Hadrurus spadix TaxID=141984 RepID=A0A1W7R9D8_9SCOR